MATWPQKPEWTPVSEINTGQQYEAADGVTVGDMNKIVGNMLYLKKYGGRVNVLVADAQVSGNKLILKSKEA